MTNQKKLCIGLFGFGVVGEGIYQVLQQTPSLNAVIKKICIRDPRKKRNVDPSLLTTDYNDILNDPEINVVVELINEPSAAFTIVTTALRKKKAVVSANKKMIAEHLRTLLNIQKAYNTPLLYEAAVCGSIPIIRNLEEYFDNELLQSVCGIVSGPDALNKLSILLLHAYGIVTKPSQLLHVGIDRICPGDAHFANERGMKIKLIAHAIKTSFGKIAAFVLPQFVTAENELYGVGHEYSGVVLQSSFADRQFFCGKGAGRFPTASAVLCDISALRFDYRYEYRKYKSPLGYVISNQYYFNLYISFNDLSQVELKDFEWIEKFQGGEKRKYLTGMISYGKLSKAAWPHHPSVSVILLPDGIIETMQSREMKMSFLQEDTGV